MKYSFLAGLLTLAFASLSFAKPPLLRGDVVLKDGRVIINKNIICSALSSPAENPTIETLVNGEIRLAMQNGDAFVVQGNLDGDLFNITGRIGGTIHLSLEPKELEAGKATPYRYTSMGSLTTLVDLTVLLNGQQKSVSCSVQK